MRKLARISFKLLDLLVIFMMVFGSATPVLADPSPTGATITTQLPDYPPGATVLMTGAGWVADEGVHVMVSADDQSWTLESNPDPIADGSGGFTYEFQLPNWFVPSYSVSATGFTSGTATLTFTDADASTNKVYQHWADAGGVEWNNNILNDNKSDYFEGEVIPHVFLYKASNNTPLTNGASYSFNVTYNWYQSTSDAGGFAYMTTYNISRQPSDFNATNPAITPTVDNSFTDGGGMLGDFYTVDANITSVSAATYTGAPGDVDGHVTITFTYSGTTTTDGLAAIYYGLYVAKPGQVPDQGKGKTNGANAWTGGSLQTTVDIGGSGATSIQLAPSAIIAGEISGLKFNDLNGNGTKDSSESGLAGWTICLDSDSDATNGDLGCVQTANGTTDDLDGNGVIDPVGFYYFSVTPGTYYVREVNQAGWTQTAPSSVYYGPLVVSATTPTYLNQNFGNHFDQGYLKITKTFDPKTSGFSGTFAIVYNCGAGNVTVNLAAGGSTTVGPFSTGTVCTISEPTLPTAPTGWSFGTPSVSGSPATIGNNTTVEVTVTNSISRDQGYLKITKSFDAKTSGFNGTFAVVYNCGAGDQTVNLAAGASTTVGPFDTGTSCSVSEPTLPTAPTGWTFGTPSVSGSPATITAGNQAAAVEVTVTNSITRDQGYLKITKSFDAKTSGFNGTFAVVYNCGAGDQTVNLAAGASTTVGPFDTGTSCSVSEPTLPSAPTGWTFGTPSVSGSPATIVKGDQAAAVLVTITNSISRDLGDFKITKHTSNLDGATLPAAFTGTYDCGTGYTGNFSVPDGGSQTVTDIPTGNTCSVVETAPAAIPGFTWGTITYTPATIEISSKGGTFEIVVGNSITRDRGNFKISKTTSNPDGATLPSFTMNYDCGLDTDGSALTGSKVIASGGSATVSGIPTGNTCSVAEVAPAVIPGYTWGTITYTPSSITIDTKGGTFEIVVGNSITRDRGNFKITKTTSNPDGATLPAAFTGTYNCGTGYTGNFSVANGASQTITGIPTGNICSVIETAPAVISGYTWGTITYTPSSITIDTKGGTFEIVVGNSITRDRGSLKVKKIFDPLTSGFTGNFSINVDCDGTSFDQTLNLAGGAEQTISGIPTGTVCTVSEPSTPTPPVGWTFGTPVLNPASGQVTITNKGVTYSVEVTNSISRDLGSLKIIKTVSGGSFSGTFNVKVECSGDGGTYNKSITYPTPGYVTITGIPTGNTCTVTEPTFPTAPAGYVWGTPSITGSPASISKGTTVEVTVANTLKTGHARVVKTVGGLPISATNNCTDVSGNIVGCTFQLRQGATTTSVGTTLETQSTLVNGVPNGTLNFTTLLTPGQTYQMCEIVMPGWLTSLGTFVPNSFLPPDGIATNPAVDNSILCGNFVAQADTTTDVGNIFTIDNTPPPGGLALTIGFWKNWASCTSSSTKKAAILDETLAKAQPNGIVVSATSGTYPVFGATFYLVLHGSTTTPKVAPDCLIAVRLLDKSTIDTNKKMSSDPAFNLAAQLVAAELNYTAGAGKKPAVTTAIQQAVLLLGKYKFDGKTHTKISAADATAMNNLATLLDNYNNNRP